jgi:hypothetical protein
MPLLFLSFYWQKTCNLITFSLKNKGINTMSSNCSRSKSRLIIFYLILFNRYMGGYFFSYYLHNYLYFYDGFYFWCYLSSVFCFYFCLLCFLSAYMSISEFYNINYSKFNKLDSKYSYICVYMFILCTKKYQYINYNMWKNNKKYIILLINKYGDGTPIYKE